MTVDDVDATRRILDSASFVVETAFSSEEALAKLEKIVPDLVILDTMMQKGAAGYLLSRNGEQMA